MALRLALSRIFSNNYRNYLTLINLNLITVIITDTNQIIRNSTKYLSRAPTCTWFSIISTYRVQRILIDCYQNSKQSIIPTLHSKTNTMPRPTYSKYSAVYQNRMNIKQSSSYYLIQIPNSTSPTACHKNSYLEKFRVGNNLRFL